MSDERFTLDTNILIYAIDAREGHKRELALQIVETAASLDCPMALQVLGEFYVVATAKLKLGTRDAAARARQLLAGFESFSYSGQAVRAALEVAATRRVSFWDGVLLASAAEEGCTSILSEDMAEGARFGSIAVRSPFWRSGLAPYVKTMLRLE